MSPFYVGLCMGRGDEPDWIRASMAGFLTFSIFFEQEGSAYLDLASAGFCFSGRMDA